MQVCYPLQKVRIFFKGSISLFLDGMFTLKTFRVGMVLVVLGVMMGIYATMTEYIDAAGMLHESFATPMAALLCVLGGGSLLSRASSFP